MDTNDFLGSWADENVSFSTQIVKTASVGQNYWTVMVFVTNDQYVNSTAAAWEDAPNTTGVKVLAVTSSTYATYTSGLLQSWLYDLFANGFTGNCILVACGTISTTYTYTAVTPEDGANPSDEGWYVSDGSGGYILSTDTTVQESITYYTRSSGTTDPASFIAGMTTAYNALKAYAYFKTVCAGADDAVNPQVALALAKLCSNDKGLLSSAPLFPCVSLTPATDPLYSVLSADSQGDYFASYHSDATHNGALYSLGIALATSNASGTAVGNDMDAVSSVNITPSGTDGTNLGDLAQTLISANVQYFKTIGDNTLSCAAYGAKTIKGDEFVATWILSYVTYMVKVEVAQLITQRNFLKNAANYARIVNVMVARLQTAAASGRLEGLLVTAPSYGDLPEADGETIIIPNAWSATYVGRIRKVTITGTLYIGE